MKRQVRMTSKSKPKPIFRFAPSPNGALHLGHAYSALLNHALAKRAKNQLIIRVEDIDTTRCTPELEAKMFEDLAWLGIEWQEPVMRQSERFDTYKQALQTLEERDLIYPAFLSRSAIKDHASASPNWPKDPDGAPLYPGLEKSWDVAKRNEAFAEGKPFSWRLDMEKALDLFPAEGAKAWGDVVLGRKEIPTSYHLAVVLDDAAQTISHIVRGLDLRASTPVHHLLQKVFNLPSPKTVHHRLITDDQGAKLSKSNKSTGLQNLRDQGASLDDILELISWDEREVDDIFSQIT